MLHNVHKPNTYTDKLSNIQNSFNVLLDKYKSLYPEYKFDPKNEEYKTMFMNTEEQLGEIFTKMSGLDAKLGVDAMNLSKVIQKNGKELDAYKLKYTQEKKQQKRLQSENLAGTPREKEYKYLLDNEYLQFGYYTAGIGTFLFLTYLLFKSKVGN